MGRGSMCAAPGGGGCARMYVACVGWGGGEARDEETTAEMGGRARASPAGRLLPDPTDVPNEEGARKDWPAGYCPKKCWEVRKDWLELESRKEYPFAGRGLELGCHALLPGMCCWYVIPLSPSYPVLVPGRGCCDAMAGIGVGTSSCLTGFGPSPSVGDDVSVGLALLAEPVILPRFTRDEPPLVAAVMVAWSEVRSRIILSFRSCLSAWTV